MIFRVKTTGNSRRKLHFDSCQIYLLFRNEETLKIPTKLYQHRYLSYYI